MDRVIVHLDMDAFFAAIEQRERPELRGKPIIIGHPGRRGVVCTCSYEARPFGIRSAMPSVTAERLCPHATWVSGRMDLYKQVSRDVFALLRELTSRVELVSVDEAYADLTGLARTLEEGAALAADLRGRIRHEHRLTASAGIAPCRYLAKIASDLNKPDGQVLLSHERIPELLWPLSVRVIPGVGPKLAEALRQRLGVSTVGELARVPQPALRRTFGALTAQFLHDRARGVDDREVVTHSERKQVSEERTYRDDLTTDEQVHRELLARAEGVAHTLRRKELVGRTVVLKVRDNRFETITRSRTLAEPTDLASEIFPVAWEMYRSRVDFGGRGLRLLGVGVKDLLSEREVPRLLFRDERREKERRAARALDGLTERYGKDLIRPARLLDHPSARKPRG
jgi:nucleotidyltransferase/DNA polymerase involved in DNA repair